MSNRLTPRQFWETAACGALAGIIVFFAGYHSAPKQVINKPTPTLKCSKGVQV